MHACRISPVVSHMIALFLMPYLSTKCIIAFRKYACCLFRKNLKILLLICIFEYNLASQQGGSEVSWDKMRVVDVFHSATSIDSSLSFDSAAIARVALIWWFAAFRRFHRQCLLQRPHCSTLQHVIFSFSWKLWRQMTCRVLSFSRKKMSVLRSHPICLLLPCVVDHPGSLDRSYDAETNRLFELRTHTHWVSTSSFLQLLHSLLKLSRECRSWSAPCTAL